MVKKFAVAFSLIAASCNPFDASRTYEGVVFDVGGICHAMRGDDGKIYAFKQGVVDGYFRKRIEVRAYVAKEQPCPGATLLNVKSIEVR